LTDQSLACELSRSPLDDPAFFASYSSSQFLAVEKFEAIVSLGMANSRMKDLHDTRSLSREFAFTGDVLSEAIARTFKTRGTELPTGQVSVFTSEFFDNEDKKKQWAAFCNKNRSYIAEITLEAVAEKWNNS
jgi:hypothetical protein